MMLKNFGQMEQFVREQSGKKRVALAAAHDADALGSLMMAVDRGIAEAILIGRRKEIVRVLDEMGKDAGDFRIIEEEDDRAAADKAVELVHCGEADMPMKGLMHTSTFMKAILDKEKGLKEDGNLLSQASVFEIPEKDRFLIISDCAVNIDPDLETKIKITENAAALAHTLGIEQPKIAVLSAVEVVNPKIRSTVDAAAMRERLSDRYLIDGPLALDNAIDEAAAHHKGIESRHSDRARSLEREHLFQRSRVLRPPAQRRNAQRSESAGRDEQPHRHRGKQISLHPYRCFANHPLKK